MFNKAFGEKFSDRFNIHRTRVGFENIGIDTFENMAARGVYVTDRAIQELIDGSVDLEKAVWYIPVKE